MKYSIVVPIYKVEKYLKKCIESLINQTYKNIEIILVDDGSPDSCPVICDEYAKKDKRINVLHKENGGLSDARNKGTQVSTGDYVMFVDSDDYLELDAIEVLNKTILETKADLVCFNLNNVDEKSGISCNNKFSYCNENTKKIIKLTYEESLIDNIEKKHIRYGAPSKIYKRNLLEKIKFPVGMLAEDFATFYLFLKEAKNIVYIDYNLYNYLQREGSIMTSKKPKLYKDILTTEKVFYKEVNKICKNKKELMINETRSFRNLIKIYCKLYKTELHESSVEANIMIRKLNRKYIKFRYRIILLAFKINDKIFAQIFNRLYKKA